MAAQNRPFRSVLYIPSSNQRALDKARGLSADAIIFDLEDAVSPSEKVAARENLVTALAAGGYGDRVQMVRINGFDTGWGADDLAAFAQVSPDVILVPKMANGQQAAELADRMDAMAGYENTKVWAMIESPEGVLNAADIAKAPRMSGFVMGTNDLAEDLGAVPGKDRAEIMTALQMALLAARAAGIVAIDGVYNAFRDDEGLIHQARQGRALGFDGKSLIHPSQIAPTNDVFSPSADDIALARRQIEAFETAESTGQGVAVLDGKIVENLHVATARKIIAIDETIRAMEG